MTNEEKRRFSILCNHKFKPASDLPANVWRCVKCADAGIMDSVQTQNLTAKQEAIMRAKHRIAVIKNHEMGK